MPAPLALIFDLDGVLVDTVGLHFRSWLHLAELHDLELTEQDMERFRGRHRRDCVVEMFAPRSLSDDEIDTLIAIKNDHYHVLLNEVEPEAILMDGAVNIIECAHQRGIPVAVASSSMNAVQVLQRTGLFERMDVVTDGGVVACAKPEPDIFIWTAGALGIPPSRCVVFEDSEAGVDAARRAGMYAVGIGPAGSLTKAHIVYPGLSALRLEDILRNAEQHRENMR